MIRAIQLLFGLVFMTGGGTLLYIRATTFGGLFEPEQTEGLWVVVVGLVMSLFGLLLLLMGLSRRARVSKIQGGVQPSVRDPRPNSAVDTRTSVSAGGRADLNFDEGIIRKTVATGAGLATGAAIASAAAESFSNDSEADRSGESAPTHGGLAEDPDELIIGDPSPAETPTPVANAPTEAAETATTQTADPGIFKSPFSSPTAETPVASDNTAASDVGIFQIRDKDAEQAAEQTSAPVAADPMTEFADHVDGELSEVDIERIAEEVAPPEDLAPADAALDAVPAVDPPEVEIPEIDVPEEVPEIEIPVVETPDLPDLDAPTTEESETHALVEAPEIETPIVDTPELPELDVPTIETPEIDTAVDTPEIETPELAAPVIETPDLPEPDAPEVQEPVIEAPEIEATEITAPIETPETPESPEPLKTQEAIEPLAIEPDTMSVPEIEVPDLDLPEIDAPDLAEPEISTIETPIADEPVQTPEIESPLIETPIVETLDAPDLDVPSIDAPEIEAPEIETSNIELPDAIDSIAPVAAVATASDDDASIRPLITERPESDAKLMSELGIDTPETFEELPPGNALANDLETELEALLGTDLTQLPTAEDDAEPKTSSDTGAEIAVGAAAIASLAGAAIAADQSTEAKVDEPPASSDAPVEPEAIEAPETVSPVVDAPDESVDTPLDTPDLSDIPAEPEPALVEIEAIPEISAPEPSKSVAPPVIEPETPADTTPETFPRLDPVRQAISDNDLEKADMLLAGLRRDLIGEGDENSPELAELTALAGDHAFAAGRVGGAKWLWRLARQRYDEAGAGDSNWAAEVDKRLNALENA